MDKNCGVCNKPVDTTLTIAGRMENDGTHTVYHLACEQNAAKLKPCEDCGHHRSFCNDCGEPAYD